jgi:omega-amidase
MKDLRITLVQINLKWENCEQNLATISKELSGLKKSATDLIILPEMFTTGFTMNASAVAETMNGKAVAFMKKLAKEKNAAVCGSLVIEDKKKFYNRLVWVNSHADVSHYNKRHLFRMAHEHLTYSSGTKKLVVELKGWKICPLVCYDLRFPVWSRTKGDVDLLIYVANWPARRAFAWKQLLIARAIENQCYVAGVNRVGKDGNGIAYTGDSVALDPLGSKLSSIGTGKKLVLTVNLNYKMLAEYRKSFPVSLDADDFKLISSSK